MMFSRITAKMLYVVIPVNKYTAEVYSFIIVTMIYYNVYNILNNLLINVMMVIQ